MRVVVRAIRHRAVAYGRRRRRRLIPVRGLEPHVYAEDEYAAQAPVVERMVAGGIPIPVAPDPGCPA